MFKQHLYSKHAIILESQQTVAVQNTDITGIKHYCISRTSNTENVGELHRTKNMQVENRLGLKPMQGLLFSVVKLPWILLSFNMQTVWTLFSRPTFLDVGWGRSSYPHRTPLRTGL